MSKGSHPRPFSVSNEEYAARWDAIFQRDLPAEVKPSLIEGIMSNDKCSHPFCDCKDVCKEAK